MKLSIDLMRKTNPLVIPRNHIVEEALDAASNKNNLVPLYDLLEALKEPYNDQSKIIAYQQPPPPSEQVYQTYCGT